MSRFGPDPLAFFDAVYLDVPPWDVGGAQPALTTLFAEYPPAGPALDVGCGSGDLAIALARGGPMNRARLTTSLQLPRWKSCVRLRPLGALCLVMVVVGVTPRILLPQDKAQPVLGLGSFLTRDRGWNFNLNIAASAGVDYRLSHVFGVRGLAILRAGGLGEGSMPVIPEPSLSIENGLTLALHFRTQPGPLGLYLLGGPEYFRVWGERRVTGGRIAVAAGVGTALGVRRRWALEGRYARYTSSIGSTRGHLDVGLLRHF